MTLFHFGNCIALAYFPYFIVYKCSGLSEYSAFWRCVKAGATYLVTQLSKEFLKSTVDIADLVGLHLVMTRIARKGELKVLVAGVGWGTMELAVTRVVPLWVGARGVEFDWKYIQMSFDANVSLIQYISTATLVWLWSRNDLQKSLLPIVMVFMVLTCYRPLLIEVLSHALGIQSWSLLLLNTFVTGSIGIVALQLYLTLATDEEARS
ncbi:Transmembrane protein 147 [Acropora cervicornis]|uniref:BOS complex subunit TMEM147 n=1 Tax=Acropora cervicornis TaxID=6130 RepID=A0AAD9VGS1_ACRCE|nr:Transmembrane protein 147 [Acropora cervicornis]